MLGGRRAWRLGARSAVRCSASLVCGGLPIATGPGRRVAALLGESGGATPPSRALPWPCALSPGSSGSPVVVLDCIKDGQCFQHPTRHCLCCYTMPQTISCDPLVERKPWLPGRPQDAAAPCHSLFMRVEDPSLTCRGDSVSPNPALGSQQVAAGRNGETPGASPKRSRNRNLWAAAAKTR